MAACGVEVTDRRRDISALIDVVAKREVPWPPSDSQCPALGRLEGHRCSDWGAWRPGHGTFDLCARVSSSTVLSFVRSLCCEHTSAQSGLRQPRETPPLTRRAHMWARDAEKANNNRCAIVGLIDRRPP